MGSCSTGAYISSFHLLKDLVAGGKGLCHLVPYLWLRPSSRAVFCVPCPHPGPSPTFSPNLPALKRILCSKKGVVLTKAEECLSTCDGEKALYQYLSSVQGLGGFQDWWARDTYSVLGGKLL